MALVLDLGGGESYLSALVAERGYRVVCVAKPGTVSAQFPMAVEVIEADLDLCEPALNELLDYVVCGDVLEHLRNPGTVLKWLRSQVKSGGKLIASLPNGVHLYVRLHVLLGMFPKHDRGLFDRTHLHFSSWTGWRQLLEASGFEVIAVRGTAVPFSLIL